MGLIRFYISLVVWEAVYTCKAVHTLRTEGFLASHRSMLDVRPCMCTMVLLLSFLFYGEDVFQVEYMGEG